MGENHHAMRARRFAERYTDDERLLAAVELHDRPYRSGGAAGAPATSTKRAFAEMLDADPRPGPLR